MRTLYIAVCIAEVAISAILLVRVWLGPSVSDRVVALNAMSTQATIAVMYFAAWGDRTFYLDVGLWLSSFSYLAALVWARYLERGLL